jgi:hypothetical protein
LGLNLHYLLTAYGDGNNDLLAHRILASAMRVLHEKSMLTREIIHDTIQPGAGIQPIAEIEGSDLENQVELVKLVPQPLSLEEITKLWSSFFQAHYRISVAYQATVVLLESEKEPKRVLPVSDRRIYVLQFRQPILERIEPQIIEQGPNARIKLTGQNLKADNVSVHFGRLAAVPKAEDIRDDQILIEVPRYLTAGIKSVQVVHPLLLGSPEVEHKGFLSNLVPFVLAPRITKVNLSPLIPNAPPIEIAHDGPVSDEFEPAVTSRQKVALLMGDLTIPVSGQDLRINAVFTWQNVPGSDSNNLKEFLRNNFSVDWIGNQQQPFTKIDEKTIVASSIDNQHSLSIRLDYEPRRATSATLTIDKKEIYEFLANVSDSTTIIPRK